MENKEIIIGGVDVSGCKEYISSLSHVCNLVNGKTDEFECNCYPNCYYKQLKRKEQECDKYKEALDEIKRYRVCEINDEDGEEGDVILGIIDETKEQNDGQTNIL